jgi:hypothetical protein
MKKRSDDHIIWQLQAGQKREFAQRDFLKHIAQTIKEAILRNDLTGLKDLLSQCKRQEISVLEKKLIICYSCFGKKLTTHLTST